MRSVGRGFTERFSDFFSRYNDKTAQNNGNDNILTFRQKKKKCFGGAFGL
jgi:hypothetical protein